MKTFFVELFQLYQALFCLNCRWRLSKSGSCLCKTCFDRMVYTHEKIKERMEKALRDYEGEPR